MRATILLILLSVSFILFTFRVFKLYKYLRLGKSEDRLAKFNLWERIKTVIINVFGQKKLLRELNPGLEHFLIFWGFIILTFGTAETIGAGLYKSFSFKFLGGYIYTSYSLMKELFGVLVITASIYGLWRRYVTKPKRFEYSIDSQFDATFILLMILTLMVTMFVSDGAKISHEILGKEEVLKKAFSSDFIGRPISYLLANFVILRDGSITDFSIRFIYETSWWLHIIILLVFLNYIPYSKHLHVLAAAPNVFLTSLSKKGELRNINLEDEKAESFGVSKIEELTWKQLLDLYSCTECGRCHIHCPATTTGKDLSPRKLILDMKDHFLKKGSNLTSKNKKIDDFSQALIGGAVKENEIWACTTCRACQEECPVFIEHVDKIIDTRRNLVLMESRFPEEMQATFKNLENNFNPWSFGYSTRADWAAGLDIPLASEKKNFEYLFWVGCAGSFDERGKKVAKAFANILKKANVDFAILGTEEKCTGDSARRLGNEYLAQILIKENIETLNKYNVKKIVTFCPHCFNAVKNDFPQFGGNYEVIHHSVFISRLIKEGKLKLSKDEKLKITYHDSCYLGRYNDIYDAPREVLKSAKGIDLVEMERSRDGGFCCGAGGGRMWLEEKEGTRISENRVAEACTLDPDVIATACPFCLTMIGDGLKVVDKSEKIKSLDIAEIVEKFI